MSTLVQRLAGRLHLGRLPEAVRAQLESEGRILYLAEGIWETALFRDFKAPGFRSSHRRMSFIGYFALSEHRVVVRAKCFHEININTAYDDALFKAITFTVQPKYLSLGYDASAQSASASGQVEIRLHLPDVPAAATILEQAGARMASNTNRVE
jgi:hypothetical protein